MIIKSHAFFMMVASVMFASPVFASEDESLDVCVRAKKTQRFNSATYKAGIDVHGKKVKSADYDSTEVMKPPPVIEFDITYDAAKRLGMNSSSYFEGSAKLAKVRIEGNKIFVNGEVINSPSAADLIASCYSQSE